MMMAGLDYDVQTNRAGLHRGIHVNAYQYAYAAVQALSPIGLH